MDSKPDPGGQLGKRNEIANGTIEAAKWKSERGPGRVAFHFVIRLKLSLTINNVKQTRHTG